MNRNRSLIFLLIVIIFCLSSCSSSENSAYQSFLFLHNLPKSTGKSNTKSTPVEVNIRASIMSDYSEEDIRSIVEKNGFYNYKINDNGSVTFTVTKEQQDRWLTDYKAMVDSEINDMLHGEKAVASFTKIEYNDDLSLFSVYVDPSKYGLLDSMYALGFYMLGVFYQDFSGVPQEDTDVIVNFINLDTNEIIDTASYKAFMASH